MEYNQLQEGDLIRALITDEKLAKTKRAHCFIIFNTHIVKNESKKRHRICIPACSFSSKIPKNQNEVFIELDPTIVPLDLFNEQKGSTILRIGKPKCIEKYQFIEYRTNLKQYPEFWANICNKVFEYFPEDLGILNTVCDCNCLEDNEIEAGYCEQDEKFIIDRFCLKKGEQQKLCSCCGYRFEEFNYDFKICPKCNDNVYIIIIEENGSSTFVY